MAVLKKTGRRCDSGRIAPAAKRQMQFIVNAIISKAETIPVLRALRESDLRIGLISDCAVDVPMIWKSCVFGRYIDYAVFSCEHGWSKPDVRLYVKACEGLGVSADECVYVGDGNSNELAGALNAGMLPILLEVSTEDAYQQERDEVKQWQGERISSLKQLPGMLFDERKSKR